MMLKFCFDFFSICLFSSIDLLVLFLNISEAELARFLVSKFWGFIVPVVHPLLVHNVMSK